MRALFVSSAYPEDLSKSAHGVFSRMRLFLDAIKTIAEIDLLFFTPPGKQLSQEEVIRLELGLIEKWNLRVNLFTCPKQERGQPEKFFQDDLCGGTSGGEQTNTIKTLLARNPDFAFAHRLACICPFLQLKVLPPVFFDLDDIEHLAFVRSISQPPYWRTKFLGYFKLPLLIRLERRAMALARTTFVCSERDRRYLSDFWRSPRVVVAPNAIPIPVISSKATPPNLLFLGSFSYSPNRVAASYLITQIFPEINKEMPETKLIIAGPNPELIPEFELKPQNVEFTGFVNSLECLYEKSRVVCCPILAGGGTRIKIIEAAAYAKPIVSTTIGAEGLDFVNNQDILLRDDATSFAKACVSLLRDQERGRKLGATARMKVIDLYDRNQIIKQISQQLLASF